MTTRPTLLLVDDDPCVTHALRRCLAGPNVEIRVANDPQSALGQLEENEIALLVTDHYMPFLTGLELLKIAADRWPETRRMVVTGDHGDPCIQGAIEAGLAEAIHGKPVDVPHFRSDVYQALGVDDSGRSLPQ